ncbi:Tl.2 family protein [Megaselia abdita]
MTYHTQKMFIATIVVLLATISEGFQVQQFLSNYCVEDSSRLTCSDFELNSNEIAEIQTEDFEISNCSIIIFKKCKISMFNEHFMNKFKSARYVKFESCELDLATVDNINSFPLTSVIFQNCVIGEIMDFAFRNYKELSSVTFIGVVFPNPILSQHLFQKNEKLTKLVLVYSGLTEIHDDMFSEIVNLDYLLLNGNSFTCPFKNTLFGRNTKLRTFIASDAEIKLIEPNLFPRSIQNIDLSLNQLETVSEDSFKGLLALKTLDIGGNNIESINEKAFNDQQNLQVLHLEYNEVEMFSKRQFQNLISLQYVNVIGNIGAEESLFEDLPNIKELYI